ncbi:unannotated protein [freshwater metagenome]|uniref:Unannotated protein n=1 Tax=freshwater metagenome TaxID=449393 RepID=A0A6J7PWC7_9ZZZZ
MYSLTMTPHADVLRHGKSRLFFLNQLTIGFSSEFIRQ